MKMGRRNCKKMHKWKLILKKGKNKRLRFDWAEILKNEATNANTKFRMF